MAGVIARALLATTLASALLAAAAPPAPLAPTGKWTLDFAATQCVALRTYGPADEPLVLALKPSPFGDLYELVLLRKASGSRAAQTVPATVRIDERPPISTDLLVYKPTGGKHRLARARLPAGADFDLRRARTLAVKARGEVDAVFALSGMAPLMTEMARCLASLQDEWNISPARAAALRSPVEGSLQRVFKSEDYPDDAIAGGAQGMVAVAMLIDEAGKVRDCTLTTASGNALLDAQSCILITQRARYKPAIGADGKPAKHGSEGRIVWRIANDYGPTRIVD